MATVTKNAETVERAGIAATYNGALSAADTYKVPNNERTVLHFKNTGGAATTVSFDIPGTVDGQAIADRTVQVPATNGDRFVGPFPRRVYGDDITFTLSVAAGVSFAAVRLP